MEMGDLRADWPVLSDVAQMRYLRYLCLTQSINVKLYLLILNNLRREDAKRYAAGSISPRRRLGENRNGQTFYNIIEIVIFAGWHTRKFFLSASSLQELHQCLSKANPGLKTN